MIRIENPLTRTERKPSYVIRLAASQDDVRRAQRLRYSVFNLELKEGLSESHLKGLDADEFDPVCDHLVVENTETGDVVGTYRLQTGGAAARNIGYYSEREFDFARYKTLRPQIVELGRACVHRDHRNFGLLHLLWRGIADYAVERKARFLVGCSSLTSQSEEEGRAMYAFLSRRNLVRPELRTMPKPDFAIPMTDGPTSPVELKPPRLLRAYLAIGAKICGPPALDREFRTIDFLTLLDLHALPFMVRAHFLR